MIIKINALSKGIASILFVASKNRFLLLKNGFLAAFMNIDDFDGGKILAGLSSKFRDEAVLNELILLVNKEMGLNIRAGDCQIAPVRPLCEQALSGSVGVAMDSLYDLNVVEVSDSEILFETRGFQLPLSKNDINNMHLI
ncbi:hypothetical protein [Aeromonas sp. MrichA-1]|uniref:hypothetical protein n=1 Tax=Aeromonas sp. MrichA-1 TaxID=2823362 RepID=UPI001B331BD8|nr:hypothetical protein [Aeromonas sp. MrichA-1]MBP4081590.1 hypothetical protein [Aeromonas sp. MrichA-1]